MNLNENDVFVVCVILMYNFFVGLFGLFTGVTLNLVASLLSISFLVLKNAKYVLNLIDNVKQFSRSKEKKIFYRRWLKSKNNENE